MKKRTERLFAFGFGIVFVIVLLLLAIAFPNPTPFQYTVFRIVLALAAGGVATMIPGFLTITVSRWIRAGGALAVFVIVYFYSPAELTGVTVKTEEQIELDKPIIGLRYDGWHGALDPPVYAASEEPQAAVQVAESLELTERGELTPEVLSRRYKTLRLVGARFAVPSGSVVVANLIDGEQGATLVGTDFSIVAQRMANVTIDASGGREPGAAAGSVHLYVKLIQNARILANGADGAAGSDGAAGKDGVNGGKGQDGNCGGFGAYRGADAGGNGGDGENGANGMPGEDGNAGGLVILTAIVNPVSTTVDVSGGRGGSGGKGGTGGAAGQGGQGGAGCTGLGGSQPSQSAGVAGKPGRPGQNGSQGRSGASGEYRLKLIKSFDSIVALLNANENAALHSKLRDIR